MTILADTDPEIDGATFCQVAENTPAETIAASETFEKFDLVLEVPGSQANQDMDPVNAEDRARRQLQAMLSYPENGFV